MGQYDFVVTVELPNDESAMSILLATGVRGNVRTTTLKAFSLSEAEKIVSNLNFFCILKNGPSIEYKKDFMKF